MKPTTTKKTTAPSKREVATPKPAANAARPAAKTKGKPAPRKR